ncbi:DNA processing protein [Mesorhizobium sp. J18]|uniref:DNA-processing protein DprA n=1 Tax=Mesorhizobium sp. J18 TaxID=935263 RepID=UPI00119AE967|nr:DNA-processing protein DprA [Mesorhizobium sp. J18]TWG99060.1 DNA processing protein [Mesorhizobium sp. J18]
MNAQTEGRRLTDHQRIAWLRLIRTENVGPATFRDLIDRFGSAEAALEMLPELSRMGGSSRSVRIPSVHEAESELEKLTRFGARLVAIGEPDYPLLLKRTDYPPPLLMVKGNASVLHAPAIGIVGARNASFAGIKFARKLAADLGREGYAIVSGLARGIDTGAHQGSIATGTIAALAGGLDRPYPPENVGLCSEIAERGAIVSEMPFGWEPRAKDFPRRNRIIAGLGIGLIVVEAAQRSGSLISARLANEMGRLVFAVPGSPLDPRAAGTNGLLKQGATIVTEAADVLSQIAPLLDFPPLSVQSLAEPTNPQAAPPPGESDRALVVEALGATPISIDEIIRHTGLHTAQVSTILLELDLAGRLERHSGGTVSLLFADDQP